MRCSSKLLLALLFFGAALAPAQTIPPGTFKHIIIVVQENRTPDNLFGSRPTCPNCQGENQFEPGVDIVDGGNVLVNGTPQPICNVSLPMNDGTLDPGHYNHDWNLDYRSGNMDGFCHGFNPPTNCPPYSYVQNSDVGLYFQLATSYGFANYMFQTNEGPSFPAHQFLFTGTSAPVAPKDTNNYYLDFLADNVQNPSGFYVSGCPHDGKYGWPTWVRPDGSPIQPPPLLTECYTHDSLVTGASYCGTQNCDKGKTWTYYAQIPGLIWDAPEGIPQVCYGEASATGNQPNPCGYNNGHQAEWGHVKFPTLTDGAPIFNDIATCKLQQITWVTPDQVWADHPRLDGTISPPLGPSWVGNIVNAIGNSYRTAVSSATIGVSPPTPATPPNRPPSSSSGTTGAAGSTTFPRPPFTVARRQLVRPPFSRMAGAAAILTDSGFH